MLVSSSFPQIRTAANPRESFVRIGTLDTAAEPTVRKEGADVSKKVAQLTEDLAKLI